MARPKNNRSRKLSWRAEAMKARQARQAVVGDGPPKRIVKTVQRNALRKLQKSKAKVNSLVDHAVSAFLQGVEILIIGPDIRVTAFLSHREALTAMAGMADWRAASDLENRSFEGVKDGAVMWARIRRVMMPMPASKPEVPVEKARKSSVIRRHQNNI